MITSPTVLQKPLTTNRSICVHRNDFDFDFLKIVTTRSRSQSPLYPRFLASTSRSQLISLEKLLLRSRDANEVRRRDDLGQE